MGLLPRLPWAIRVVAEGHVRTTEIIQCAGHHRAIATVLALEDRERALQYGELLGGIAKIPLREPKLIQRQSHLLALRTELTLLHR